MRIEEQVLIEENKKTLNFIIVAAKYID